MAESRVEDLLETGVEEPVLPMSEIEAILRGEPVKPHSRIAELLLKYNPKDILIEKRITENGTYFASSDEADGYYKVVVDEYVPTLILKQVTQTYGTDITYNPSSDNADGYSSVRVTVPDLNLELIGLNITSNGLSNIQPSPGYDAIGGVALNVAVAPNVGTKQIDDNGTYNASTDNLDGYSSVTVAVPKGTNANIRIRCLGVDGGTVTITSADQQFTHTKSVTLTDETVIFDNLEYAGVWTVTNSKDTTTETVNNTYTEGSITLMVSKIPQMTSASTPYGECISSTNNWGESRYVWYPFDGYDGPIDNSTSEAWSNQRGDSSPWIGYHFMDSQGNPIKVKLDKVWVQGFCVVWGNSTTRTLYFEGSNDGTNWEKIGLDKIFDFSINTRRSFEHELNGGKYEYFRIRFDASLNVVDSRWIFIERIQVYANDFAPLPTGALTATENGTYDPEDYDFSAFDEVNVNVPLPSNAYLLKDIPSTPTDIATITDGANFPMPYLKIGVEAWQEGSGDPSPSNVRPIHGWDEVKVSVMGKNLLNSTSVTVGYIRGSDGAFASSSSWKCSVVYTPIKPNTSYVLRKYQTSSSSVAGYALYDKDKNYISGNNYGTATSLLLNTPSNAMYIRASWSSGADTPVALMLPTAPEDFEPYIGSIYTIDLDGTRYGGYIEIVNGETRFVATWAEVDLSTLSWNALSNNRYKANIATLKIAPLRSLALMCDKYKTNIGGGAYDDMTIYNNSNDASVTVVDSSTSTITGQLVYELAESVIIPLGNYPISTLEGENNLFADSGQILDGEYLAK